MIKTRYLVPLGCLVVLFSACKDRDRTYEQDRPSTMTPGESPRIGTTERDKERTGSTTITGAHIGLANDASVQKIVAARCAREATCSNVGPNKRYVNKDVCTQKVRTDMKEDLNAKECPHGIDEKELNECLEAIQKEDCNNPIDIIGRLAACRTGDLCLKTSAPNH